METESMVRLSMASLTLGMVLMRNIPITPPSTLMPAVMMAAMTLSMMMMIGYMTGVVFCIVSFLTDSLFVRNF